MTDFKTQSKAAFNKQAPTYDQDQNGCHARSLYPALLARLSAIPYDTALDLGCGTGEVMRLILQQNQEKSLYGIDLSENMLEIARAKLPDQVSLYLGDSEHLPFPDSFFDVVYCNDSFHHYPAPSRVLSEVCRVLKPQGIFLICDTWHTQPGRTLINFLFKHSKGGDVKLYSEREMRSLFSPCFSQVTWERLGHSGCMTVGVK